LHYNVLKKFHFYTESRDEMELGDKIRSLRQKQKISIENLSEMSGLSKGLISQIERDITGPSVASLGKFQKPLMLP